MRKSRWRSLVAGCASVAAGAGLLLRFPPERYGFYPRCPIYTYLHVQCPGCGTTRALAALLHGHVREAVGLNPLTMALLPLLLAYLIYGWWRGGAWKLDAPQPLLYAGLAVSVGFALLRNLPG